MSSQRNAYTPVRTPPPRRNRISLSSKRRRPNERPSSNASHQVSPAANENTAPGSSSNEGFMDLSKGIPETQESGVPVVIPETQMETTSDVQNHESIAALVGSIMERYMQDMRTMIQSELQKVNCRDEEQQEQLQRVEEKVESTDLMLCAMALRTAMKTKEKQREYLRPQVQVQVDLVKTYLTQDIMMRTGCHIICKVLTAHMTKLRHSFECAPEIFEVLLFAPDSENRTRMRRTETGRALKDIRYCLIGSYVHNCCRYAKEIDDENRAVREALLDSGRAQEVDKQLTLKDVEVRESFLNQAVWTRAGYITDEDMKDACDVMMRILSRKRWEKGLRSNDEPTEDGTTTPKSKQRRPNSAMYTLGKQIKHEVVKQMWRHQTDWLNWSRQELRKSMSKCLGFLFVDSANAQWKFKTPRSYYGKVDSIGKTRVYVGDELLNIESVTKHNKTMLNKLYADFPRLKLNCSYNVDICSGERGKRNWKKMDTVSVEREICLIECALKCVTVYNQLESHDELMRFVEESLHTVYLVAMALATILEQSSEWLQEGKSNVEVLSERFPKRIFIEAENARMDAINDSMLQLSEEEYEDLLEHGDDDKENSDPQTQGTANGRSLNNAVINTDLF